MSNLAICRFMKGWRYDWVEELPVEVYQILMEEMQKQGDTPDVDEDDFS